MRQLERVLFALIFFGLLAGCGGGHKEPKLTLTNMADLKTTGQAIVVLSTQSTVKATYGAILEGGLNTTWSPTGKNSAFDFTKMMITTPHNTKDTPRIAKLHPGTYNLLEFNYTSSNIKTSNSAGMKGLPLSSFKVMAGDVIYLGNFRVHIVAKFFGSTKGFDLIVENNEATARAYLAKQAPELASQMKTRLLKISPLFSAMKKIAKK